MSFGHQIISTNFSGVAAYTQLISGEFTESGTGNWLPIVPDGGAGTPDTELDNKEFGRGTPSVSSSPEGTEVMFWDAPNVGLHNGNGQENVNFKTYLLFKPDVVSTRPNIFVPLRLITWNLQDEADNGVYVSGNPVIPTDEDFSEFPDWQHVFRNSGFRRRQ